MRGGLREGGLSNYNIIDRFAERGGGRQREQRAGGGTTINRQLVSQRRGQEQSALEREAQSLYCANGNAQTGRTSSHRRIEKREKAFAFRKCCIIPAGSSIVIHLSQIIVTRGG